MIRFKNMFVLSFVVMSLNAYSQSYKLPVVQQPVFKKDTFNIVKFGAKADLTILNSDAINKAIDA